jgi:hypothetical protein
MTDQRGLPRPVDGDLDGTARCDPGAFELGGTTPVTTSTTATSTTFPSVETCGNCVDDDGNGLTDFEDLACCAAEQSTGLILKRVRIKPKSGMHALSLAAILTQGDLDLGRQDLFVQLRQQEAGGVLCARLPAERFTQRGARFRFADKTHVVTSAGGIERAKIKVKRDQSAEFAARGKQVTLAAPAAGAAQITLSAYEPGSASGRCAGASVGLQAGKKGSLRYP